MAGVSPGQRLRAWREAAQKTQTECAAELGVGQPTWSEWEAGTRVPRTSHAFAIEKFTRGKVPARTFAEAAA